MLFTSSFSFRRLSYGNEKQEDLEQKRKEVVVFSLVFHLCSVHRVKRKNFRQTVKIEWIKTVVDVTAAS